MQIPTFKWTVDIHKLKKCNLPWHVTKLTHRSAHTHHLTKFLDPCILALPLYNLGCSISLFALQYFIILKSKTQKFTASDDTIKKINTHFLIGQNNSNLEFILFLTFRVVVSSQCGGVRYSKGLRCGAGGSRLRRVGAHAPLPNAFSLSPCLPLWDRGWQPSQGFSGFPDYYFWAINVLVWLEFV